MISAIGFVALGLRRPKLARKVGQAMFATTLALQHDYRQALHDQHKDLIPEMPE
jgi:hypothetical protein